MSKPELIYGLDEQAYHADTDTLSASAAKVLLGKRPPSAFDALLLGTLTHTVALEPDRLNGYVVLDAAAIAGIDRKTGKPYTHPTMTNKYKEAVAEAEKSGKTCISQDDWDKAHAMVEAIRNHPEAARVMASATGFEVSAYADHPTGARVRGRFDLIGPGFIADIKTCRDGDPETFGKTMHNLGYHVSAANYVDLALANGLKVDRFDFICVEKEPTLTGKYRVSVNEIHPDALDKGRELMTEACNRWLALNKVVDLPDYSPGRTVVDLPAYAYFTDLDDIQLQGVS